MLSLAEQFSASSNGGVGKADFYFISSPPLLWSIVCFESAGPACRASELSESYSLAVRKWEINSKCGTFKSDSAKIVWGTFLELLKGNYFLVWKTVKQTFRILNIFISPALPVVCATLCITSYLPYTWRINEFLINLLGRPFSPFLLW